jgi:hypothetical protein
MFVLLFASNTIKKKYHLIKTLSVSQSKRKIAERHKTRVVLSGYSGFLHH